MEHILDRRRSLGKFVKHDDCWLAMLQLQRSVGEILGHSRLAVDAWHGDVAQVLLRTVEVGIDVAIA